MSEEAPPAAEVPAETKAEVPAGERINGTVKWFNSQKGFGFVTPNGEGAEDVFVHQSSIHAEGFRSLGEGEVVEFSIDRSEEGRAKAVAVTGPTGSFVQGAPRRGGFGGRGGGGRGRGRGRGGRGRGPPGPPRTLNEEGDPVSSGLQVVCHNLPWSMTWQVLKDFFKEAGTVHRTDIAYGDDGRSKGFGTVCFSAPEEAAKAIEMFNETEIQGRKISVRLDNFA